MRGWDEFELEVVRDRADNVVIVCSIENLDPMGVHTGDSVTVAPQMTLSDEAYQELRDAAVAIIRAVGVDTGGSNIQFARDRETGELRVIEMNPRVSRSSALASKATGYPIAKVAAKLAVGYTLDEIPNDLTGTTPASFEPTLDYVVVKFPRFAFEKFPGADTTLGTQMKSVGEAMGIGRTFAEAFAKARRGLDGRAASGAPENLHPWFARELDGCPQPLSESRRLPPRRLVRRRGRGALELLLLDARRARRGAARSRAGSVVILGCGPNRIGQGIEFDYCCVHAAQSFRAQGYEAVMVNCNPETVSTDYDTSDRLYFEPLDEEEVLAVLEREQPDGVVHPVRRPDAAQARARDRARRASASSARRSTRSTSPRTASASARLAERLGVRCPEWGIAASRGRGGRDRRADRLPGARAAVVRARRARDARLLRRRARSRAAMAARRRARCSSTASSRTRSSSTSTRSATASDTYVAAVMEHVEEAGVHSGDSSCVLPGAVRRRTRARRSCAGSRRRSASSACSTSSSRSPAARSTCSRSNPRASRTVPFASKATASTSSTPPAGSRPARALAELDLPAEAPPAGRQRQGGGAAVRALPRRRPRARAGDALDRRGDGERGRLRRPRSRRPSAPPGGRCRPAGARSSPCATRDKADGRAGRARRSRGLGFELVATAGTARALARGGARGARRREGRAGRRPHPAPAVRLVVNTPEGRNARPTATRSARRPSSRACRASRRSPARGRGRRDREGARRAALSLQERHARRERRSVVAVEAVGPYTLVRVDARLARPRRARGSSSCSRRRGGCCRGRCRSASRRAASSRS